MNLFNIENDCLYKNFKHKYYNKSEYKDLLSKGGYIEENRTDIDNKAIYDYNLISLPILETTETDKLAIIVSTGSFSPLHDGHIESMEMAKKHVEYMGYKVVQGVISLSHDKYVSYKNNGIAKLNVSKRTQIVYEKIKDIDWLTVDRFEGELVNCPINFSTVLERVKLYFEFHSGKKVKIFYVFGSDNVDFSYSFVNNIDYNSICVERSGYDYSSVLEDLKEFKNIHFLKNNSINSKLSSTEIRKRKNIIKEKEKEKENLIYFIRTDDVPILFAEKLKFLVSKYLNKDVEIRLFNSNDLSYDMSNCISMDKYIKGEYNLDLSRVFQLSGYQNKANGMCSLKEDISKQLSKIKKGSYKLIDDDSVSGYTMNKVTEMLSLCGVNVLETGCLVSSLLKDNEVLYDIIDARDFLFGANNGGLVISLFGNERIRVPYVFPFVNLTTRANIRPECQIVFTKELLEVNLSYSFSKDTQILKYLCYNDNKGLIESYLIYIDNYLGF